MTGQDQHQSVLLQEAVEALVTDPAGRYVDCTFGRGGHSRRILEQLGPEGRLLVIDKDPQAIAVAMQVQAHDSRVAVWTGGFVNLHAAVVAQGWKEVHGVLLDLGVSSPQLDEAERGFSFNKDGPLDMRMDNSKGRTAAQWLQGAEEAEIAQVLWEYGEEKFSRRMAKAIVAARCTGAISSTLQLAEIVKQANPAWERHKHPATRAFQAIRIFINDELQELAAVLPAVVELLVTGGRMVVISFHSLEDRLVKQFIRRMELGDDLPMGVPIRADQVNSRLRRVGRAVQASQGESEGNVRARSAVMRVAEKKA
jgi:16S rRNA (cytosine1402-N4)-methyltransferase